MIVMQTKRSSRVHAIRIGSEVQMDLSNNFMADSLCGRDVQGSPVDAEPEDVTCATCLRVMGSLTELAPQRPAPPPPAPVEVVVGPPSGMTEGRWRHGQTKHLRDFKRRMMKVSIYAY
jgi:hypothetical protein